MTHQRASYDREQGGRQKEKRDGGAVKGEGGGHEEESKVRIATNAAYAF